MKASHLQKNLTAEKGSVEARVVERTTALNSQLENLLAEKQVLMAQTVTFPCLRTFELESSCTRERVSKRHGENANETRGRPGRIRTKYRTLDQPGTKV